MEPETDQLTISKERVLEAANKCSTAKDILKVLFPEVFKESKDILFPNEVDDLLHQICSLLKLPRGSIAIRHFNGYSKDGLNYHAFYLGSTSSINWEFKIDPDSYQGAYVLIPTRK